MSQQFTVRECLHGYTTEALGAICQQWRLAANSKASRIRAVDKILRDPLHVKSAVKRLQADEVRLLHLVLHRGHVAMADLLNVPGLFSLNQARSTLLAAMKRGFVVVCPLGRSGAFSLGHLNRPWQANEAGPVLVVPALVGKYLPKPVPLGIPAPHPFTPKERPLDGSPDSATVAFLETLRVVELLAPRITSAGELHKTDEARALQAGREVGLSAESLGLSLMVACELGCVAAKEGRLVTTRKADHWAEQRAADRTRDLFQAYLRGEPLPDLKMFFPELSEALEERLPPGSLRRTYHRTLVAQALKEIRENQWCSVGEFVAILHGIDPNVVFLEERWRAIKANVRDVTAHWKARQWRLHEQRLFSWMIQRFLYDLGMVVLTENRELFRLTPLGRYALDLGLAPPDGRKRQHNALVVQPNFEIIAYLDRCPANVRRKLDTFCDRVRGGAVSTYRLTRESVYRGIRMGAAAPAFLGLLEKHAERAVPPNVREQVAAWQRKLETITIHTRCQLVECSDAEDAAKYALAVSGSRPIGERFVLMSGTAKEVGITVDYGRSRAGSLRQEQGLQLRAAWDTHDLFLKRALSEIGDLETDDRGDLVLRLTPGKVERDKDPSLIAAQLEALCQEPLAARYRVALRASCGDLGAARSCNATLVRFEDREPPEAVMELPDVACHVEGRLGSFTLVIRQGQLGLFKKKLRQHGIALRPGTTVVDDQQPGDRAAPPAKQPRQPPRKPPASEDKTPQGDNTQGHNEATLPSYSPRIVQEILEDAIARRRPVLIEYAPAWGSSPSIRRVDPVSLLTSGTAQCLSGYCHTHQGPRTFKLARIFGIRVIENETY